MEEEEEEAQNGSGQKDRRTSEQVHTKGLC
jgi:hypothetical protein